VNNAGTVMRRAIAILAVMLSTAALSASVLSPEKIAADVKAHGAKAVVDRLFASGDYDRVMDRAGRGEAKWLALVPLLEPGTDAGTAEELPIALAFALPHNAKGVLALIAAKDFSADDVCSAPFIENTVKDVPGYIRKARAAVAAVNDPVLAGAKSQCLAALTLAANPQ
jgi:hypothetical protein